MAVKIITCKHTRKNMSTSTAGTVTMTLVCCKLCSDYPKMKQFCKFPNISKGRRSLLFFNSTKLATKYQNGEANNVEARGHLKLNPAFILFGGENFSVNSNEVPTVDNTEWVPRVELKHSVPPLK